MQGCKGRERLVALAAPRIKHCERRKIHKQSNILLRQRITGQRLQRTVIQRAAKRHAPQDFTGRQAFRKRKKCFLRNFVAAQIKPRKPLLGDQRIQRGQGFSPQVQFHGQPLRLRCGFHAVRRAAPEQTKASNEEQGRQQELIGHPPVFSALAMYSFPLHSIYLSCGLFANLHTGVFRYSMGNSSLHYTTGY